MARREGADGLVCCGCGLSGLIRPDLAADIDEAGLDEGLAREGVSVRDPGPEARTSIVLVESERVDAAQLVDRLAAAGIRVSRRGTGVRVSPHLYNSSADLDRLLGAIHPLGAV